MAPQRKTDFRLPISGKFPLVLFDVGIDDAGHVVFDRTSADSKTRTNYVAEIATGAVRVAREDVDELALGLVPPLQADDAGAGHGEGSWGEDGLRPMGERGHDGKSRPCRRGRLPLGPSGVKSRWGMTPVKPRPPRTFRATPVPGTLKVL